VSFTATLALGITRDGACLNDVAAELKDFAEARLIDQARRGDTAAFEALYRNYVGRVHGLCLRMCRDHATAEDCVQETFINAWRNLARFELRSTFGTWLHSIAVNAVLGRSRRKLDHHTVELSELDEPVDTHWPDTGAAMDLERLIQELPEGARYVLVLQAIYGYTHEETAVFLGIAVGTCKAQLHRARKLLAKRMAQTHGVQL
jgi:RNA polymerase sigma-70 factor (ECF subfamily)